MRSTSSKLYLALSGTIFLLVAVLHWLRLVYQWPVVVGPWTVPLWLSYAGLPVASGYCVWGYRLLSSERR